MRPAAPLVLCLALGAPLARAQTRPLLTEEATTPPGGTLRLEVGAEAITNEASYLTGRERFRWDAPILRATYAPSDRVELDLEWVARVGTSGERDRESVSDWGDLTLRAKLRLLGGNPRATAFAARFGVTLPQTSFNDVAGRPLGLGPNTLRAFVQGLVTQPLGRASVHLNGGLQIHEEVFRPHEQRDFFYYGLALAVPAGAFEAVAEVAGRTGEGMPGAEAKGEARAGVRYGRGTVRGDLAVRHGLTAADGDWGATVGVTFAFRPRTAGGQTPPGS
jgi:hypothetical protein